MALNFSSLLRRPSIYLLVGALMGGILAWPRMALGQMQVSPLVIETQARRGQAQGVVSVTNVSDSLLRARVYAEPFTYTDTGLQLLAPGTTAGDLTPYLQFSPTELTVPPGATRRIRLMTRFPPSIPSGEYRAMIFAETLSDPSEVVSPDRSAGGEAAGPVMTIKVRIGSAFYVRQGEATSHLKVVGASWNPVSRNPQLRLENTGTASEQVGGEWQLKQGESLISKGSLPPSTVVAQSQRHLQLRPANPDTTSLPAGDYQLVGEIFWLEADRPQRLPFNLTVTIPSHSSP